MSTLKATYLQQAASTNPNITLDGSANATVGGTLVMGSSFKRNRIINGDMRVAQRGTSFTTTGYNLDRWAMGTQTAGAYTLVQSSTAPVGFVNSLQYTKTTGNAPNSTDANFIYQAIEGVNAADLGWGTANAKTVTLSFWVYSGATGTFSGSLRSAVATYYSYPFTYTVSAINTWEYKTVTIAGPGAGVGTWATNTDASIYVFFDLGSGTSLRTTANAWASGSYVGVTSASTYPTSTSGGTIYFTGVQLEVGSIATPYERQIYTDQLLQCQRYYWRATGSATGAVGFPAIGTGVISATTQALIAFPWSQNMRIVPTLGFSGNVTLYDASSSASVTSITTTYGVPGSGLAWAVITASGGSFTAGRGAFLYPQNASTNWFEGSAEL